MPADLANNAAAVTEGYALVQIDRGASAPTGTRYTSRYEKTVQGDGTSGGRLRVVEGKSEDVQATADANALAALNGCRRYIFGTDATNVNKGQNGNTLAVGRH